MTKGADILAILVRRLQRPGSGGNRSGGRKNVHVAYDFHTPDDAADSARAVVLPRFQDRQGRAVSQVMRPDYDSFYSSVVLLPLQDISLPTKWQISELVGNH